MLKIIIENATFTCHEAGQVIDVALVKAEEWLHEGSIICPYCTVGNLTFVTSFLFLKFIYSEKATKFCEIFPLLLTVCTVVKSKGKISQNFVTFSEYMKGVPRGVGGGALDL